MNPSSQFVTVAIGMRSPFPALPADQLTVMMSLAQSNPVVIVSLPKVTDEDIANIKAPLQAVALRRSTRTPAGTLGLMLDTNEEEVWPICIPILDEALLMRTWA